MKETKKTEEKQTMELNFSVVGGNSRDLPDFDEKKDSYGGTVKWGKDNKMPMYLWNLYLKSALLNSIINGTAEYISGDSVVLADGLSRFNEEVNEEGDTINDLVSKLALDLMIYDGFTMQIINDRSGNISELYWTDIRKCRLDEEETKILYCDKWGSYGSNNSIEYPVWYPGTTEKTSIFYFKGHRTRGIYPIPRYTGALAAIETSTEIGKFHLNNILNNMSSSAIISFNGGVPSEEEKDKIEKKLNEKFSGADNAGKFVTVYNDNKEHEVTIARLSEDNLDKKFETLAKSTQNEIFTAFRAQPILFGLLKENNGFAKDEYLQAFELYNKTVVSPAQKDIKRCFDKVFGIKNAIEIKPFKVYDVDGDQINNLNKAE